jgi:hypothetical protein
VAGEYDYQEILSRHCRVGDTLIVLFYEFQQSRVRAYGKGAKFVERWLTGGKIAVHDRGNGAYIVSIAIDAVSDIADFRSILTSLIVDKQHGFAASGFSVGTSALVQKILELTPIEFMSHKVISLAMSVDGIRMAVRTYNLANNAGCFFDYAHEYEGR